MRELYAEMFTIPAVLRLRCLGVKGFCLSC